MTYDAVVAGIAEDGLSGADLGESVAIPEEGGLRGSAVYGAYVDEVVAYTQTVGGVTKRYYPHYNHLYSVAALTDGTTGAVVERYTYDAYGKQKITDASGNVTRAKSSVGWDRGFTGYITDNETGLLHARARQYSTTLGRFVNRDPWMRRPIQPDRTDDVGAKAKYEAYFKFTRGRDGSVDLQSREGFAVWTLGPFNPMSGDGYADSMSLYSAAFVPNNLDPSGNTIWKCVRPVQGFPCIGNHAYLWDDRTGRSCGMTGSSGSGATSSQSDLPPGSSGAFCWPLRGLSDQQQDQIMQSCEDHALDGMWFPFANDCHSAADAACQSAGVEPPPLPRIIPILPGTPSPPLIPPTAGSPPTQLPVGFSFAGFGGMR